MRANLLIYPEGRKLYFMSRDNEGNVWNIKTLKSEPYKEKKRKFYAQPVKYAGGDMYILPDVLLMIVYEQKGKKPDKEDKIIATFGNIKINQLSRKDT